MEPDGALDPAALPSFEAETGPCSDVGHMLVAACHRQETQRVPVEERQWAQPQKVWWQRRQRRRQA